ncbi:unnamed protein product [Cuscuta europaea]|uniref:Uncharacterized protein n=1 Tax=Cuscuta europaea TaxID=41803 RepID=A0A9P1E631_CUSEU|nr:unnamed protein product [Cuscuta europaea]
MLNIYAVLLRPGQLITRFEHSLSACLRSQSQVLQNVNHVAPTICDNTVAPVIEKFKGAAPVLGKVNVNGVTTLCDSDRNPLIRLVIVVIIIIVIIKVSEYSSINRWEGELVRRLFRLLSCTGKLETNTLSLWGLRPLLLFLTQ